MVVWTETSPRQATHLSPKKPFAAEKSFFWENCGFANQREGICAFADHFNSSLGLQTFFVLCLSASSTNPPCKKITGLKTGNFLSQFASPSLFKAKIERVFFFRLKHWIIFVYIFVFRNAYCLLFCVFWFTKFPNQAIFSSVYQICQCGNRPDHNTTDFSANL